MDVKSKFCTHSLLPTLTEDYTFPTVAQKNMKLRNPMDHRSVKVKISFFSMTPVFLVFLVFFLRVSLLGIIHMLVHFLLRTPLFMYIVFESDY